MPEGDTVLVTARRMHDALAGQVLEHGELRMPRFATSDLSGQTVAEVVARGKHILLRTDGELTLHSHLKADGAWHLHKRGEKWRGPSFQARAILRTAKTEAVGFRLGICELIRSSEEAERLRHLGPDVLGEDWNREEALRRLRLHPEREIGTMLIDQKVMAGPGNNFKSEACFLEGIYPWDTIDQVEDLEGLVDRMKKIMEANRTIGRQVTTGDARRGRERWVAGRWRLPCRRCGTPIEKADQASYEFERITFWCPNCQVPQMTSVTSSS